MRIAVDARELESRPTGVGRVLEGLLQEWSDHDRLLLVSRSEPRLRREPRAPFRCEVRPGPRALPGALWEQLVLPGRARAFGAEWLLSPAYGMPRFLSCPAAVGMHDCAFDALPGSFRPRERWRRRRVARLAARRAAFLFMGSRFAAAEARSRLGVEAERLLVLPYGVDDRFRPQPAERVRSVRERYALPDRPLLLIGAHLERRGLPGLDGAVERLSRMHPGAALCRFGDRPGQGMGGRWLGWVPDDDLPAVYAAAEAVLYPSIYEGFGLPVLEALACGTPVLTSDVASLREIYAGRATLLPPGDTGAWTDALADLLARPERHRSAVAETAAWAARRGWSEPAAMLRDRMLAAAERP